MSHLLRWVRHNQSLAVRCQSLLGKSSAIANHQNINESYTKPLYRIMSVQTLTSSSTLQMAQPPPPPPSDARKSKPTESKKQDDIQYVISLKKGFDFKKTFKDFYSLYGPLFLATHVGISLLSLGFFCSLAWFAIDITELVPDFVNRLIGQTMASMTGAGGKFIVAYAIHKLILPFRLGAAIYVTRSLSRLIKSKKSQPG